MRCYTVESGKLEAGIKVTHGPTGIIVELGSGNDVRIVWMFESHPPIIGKNERIYDAYPIARHTQQRGTTQLYFLARPNDPFDKDVLVRIDTRGQNRGTNTGTWRPIQGSTPTAKVIGHDRTQRQPASDSLIVMSEGQVIQIDTRGFHRPVRLSYPSPETGPWLLV